MALTPESDVPPSIRRSLTMGSALRGAGLVHAAVTNAIGNGGFETGALAPWYSCWAGTPTPPLAAVSTANPHNGRYDVFAGSLGSPEIRGLTGVCQAFVVPKGGTLSAWIATATNDNRPSIAYQYSALYTCPVPPTNGGCPQTLKYLKTVYFYANTHAWQKITYDLSAYAGKTLFIFFGVAGDGTSGKYINQYLDDVSLPGVVAGGSLRITGADNRSPMSMGAVHLTVSGLKGTANVNVSYNATGCTLTQAAVKVVGKTVTVAAPICMSPQTGSTAPATVSLTLRQGTQSSNAVALHILDMPTLAEYGVPVGTISKTFLQYESILVGMRLGALQALQASRGNTIDTSQAQSNAVALLKDTVGEGYDVSNVIANPNFSTQIDSMPDGAPVYYNSQSVEMMDRESGTYLINVLKGQAADGDPRAQKLVRQYLGPDGHRPRTTIIPILNGLAIFTDVISNLEKTQQKYEHGQTNEAVLAALAASASFMQIVGVVSGQPEIYFAAKAAGGTIATIQLGVDIGNVVNDIQTIENATTEGPAAVAEAEADFKGRAGDNLDIGIEKSLNSVLDGAGDAYKIYTDMTSGNDANNPDFQSGQFAEDGASIASSSSAESQTQTIDAGATQIATDYNTSTPEDFQIVNGQAAVNGTAGELETDVEIGDPYDAPTSSAFTDPNGDFEIEVPLDSTTLNYTNMVAESYDEESGSAVTIESINLSSLTLQSGPETLPTLNASCVDTDAAAPDGDEPDCDTMPTVRGHDREHHNKVRMPRPLSPIPSF